MPHFGYSITDLDETKGVKASGRELRISPKAAREICKTIKGMSLVKAKELLIRVTKMEQPIPYFRHHKKVAHKRGLERWKQCAGRYPVKAAKAILKVLENLEANAEQKNLDIDRLRIIHACAHRGRKIRRYMPRAFGRATPKFEELVHVELAAEEV